MFGDRKNSSSVTTAKAIKPTSKKGSDSAVTILTSGCHFTGKLYCRGSSRIAGEIEGQVISEGLLVVEEGAVINGDIEAEEVVIHGRVIGTIKCSGRVALAPSCSCEGDIHSPSLVIAEGASFVGRSNTGSTAKNKTATLDRKKDNPVKTPVKAV